MSNQLRLLTDIPAIKPAIKVKGKYKQWKYDANYQISENAENCCGTCQNHIAIKNDYNSRIYHKCNVMGVSNCSSTDIRVSYICDFYSKDSNEVLKDE